MNVLFPLFSFLLLLSCVPGLAQAPHTRLVWVQDHGDGRDVFAKGENLQLMVSDNRVAGGEASPLIGTAPRSPRGNYAKPLMTPRGDRVVYSNRRLNKVYVADFRPGEAIPRELADGFAAEVWRHPTSGKEFALVMTGPQKVKSLPGYRTATMVQIDNPKHRFPLWHGPLVAADNFQLSADGTKAGALFPWPHGGIADLATGTYTKVGRGCWTSFAPDNSYVLWIFDGAHRNAFVHQGGREWKLPLHTAPGIGNGEVYHPRWSNHPHYVVMTGPYASSRILEGGHGVEVWLGRIRPDLRVVEEWTQITTNKRADFFPDAWIEGGEHVRLDFGSDPSVAALDQSAAGPARPATAQIDGKLLEISPIPSPAAILPYKRCLVAGRYQLPGGEELAGLHWGILDGKTTPRAQRRVGWTYPLRLVPFDKRKDLRSDRISNDLENVLLELFVDEASVPPPG